MELEDPTPDGCFCVQFSLASEERFEMLNAVVVALRDAKAGEFTDAADPYWQTLFDDDALKYFWWPTPEELADWQHRWESTAPDKRLTDPALKTSWDFASMIDAFESGDYHLVELRRLHNGSGQLLFDPHGFPFGGTGCMHALIESFGGTVSGETMP